MVVGHILISLDGAKAITAAGGMAMSPDGMQLILRIR